MREESYERFQDRIFQEIRDKEQIATREAVEQFVQYAATQGFTIDQLIEMSESGMSGAQIWEAVHSNKPTTES